MKNLIFKATVCSVLLAVTVPVAANFYAVDDKGAQDSQLTFVAYNEFGATVTDIGSTYEKMVSKVSIFIQTPEYSML